MGELELHAQECQQCRGLLRMWTALDEYAAPAVSADFDQRLYARLAEEPARDQRSWARRVLWPSGPLAWWKPAIPVAACAALAVALLVRGPDGGASPAGGDAKVEPVNIEQVEQVLQDLDLLAPALAQGAPPAAL